MREGSRSSWTEQENPEDHPWPPPPMDFPDADLELLLSETLPVLD